LSTSSVRFDDQCDGPEVKITGGKAFSDCCEAVPQNLGVPHLAGGQCLGDALSRRNFGGNPVPAIQGVTVTRIGPVEVGVPVDEHADSVQPSGTCLRLGTLCRRDHIDQIGISQ
jgi:hypothetical protein